jgi:hypothetical protein
MNTVRVSLSELEPHLANHIVKTWKGASPDGTVELDQVGWVIHPETRARMGRSPITQELASRALSEKPAPLVSRLDASAGPDRIPDGHPLDPEDPAP